MIQAPSARGKARSFTFLVAFVIAVGVVAACSESPRANGQACLKDSDCLSGSCVASLCAAEPTLLDAEVSGDGGTVDSTAADVMTVADTGTAAEAAPEAAADSGKAGGDSGAAETGVTDSGSQSDSPAE
jgi:hypothetical protein